jgi:hypothetical protein
MKIQRTTENLHPLMNDIVRRIQERVIHKHTAPFRLFETGREKERHSTLIQRGKTKDLICKHLYNLENDPPLYATAIDYVYYSGKWSWNLRDNTISSWYILFGNLVLDECPELVWAGMNRKATNYSHFELNQTVVIDKLGKYPCVTY